MKKRNPIAVAIFGFITFGIYSIYWNVKTKGQMNEKGANIPTAWLIIVPFVNIWWLWKWSEGVEHVTDNKMSGVIAFILEFALGPVGDAVIQDTFNKLPEESVPQVNLPADMASVPPTQTEAPVTPPEEPTPPANPVS